ncbi:hypothetical protein DC522_28265 [Microvirga sp. KLBC 81]|uniref:hypothetical protein n=1 Tax=Microvirga sp. KLBC 81 TaxID=1862707 RepID=UPI000D51F598|nr:hypothetical protein [Microvirga sp. KLBC 81]PVE21122.1 hypothetical protein DC522_28265 [Microvirga sp. KLBC 81]
MFAVLFYLSVLFLLAGACLARPVRHAASVQACASGQQPMPNLNALLLRSNPSVFATGRLIKGLYYSEVPKGPNAMAAFHMACDRLLEQKPFLVMDFRSSQFFLDGDRDGCIDASGTLSLPQIDPADFLLAVDGAEEICNEDLIGQRHLNDLASVP